ncbi:EGLN1 protein, partial [Atractosteus spatula]|nr:EGLN1 protein [Atractosteus spatula]
MATSLGERASANAGAEGGEFSREEPEEGSSAIRCTGSPNTVGSVEATGGKTTPPALCTPHSNRPAHGREHRRRVSSHKLVLQYIVPCMTSYGLCIVNNFLGSTAGDKILEEVLRLHQSGKFQHGELATGTRGKNKSIRGDKITWVDGMEPGCGNIGFLLSRMDRLVTFADGKLGSYTIRGRHKLCRLPLRRLVCGFLESGFVFHAVRPVFVSHVYDTHTCACGEYSEGRQES